MKAGHQSGMTLLSILFLIGVFGFWLPGIYFAREEPQATSHKPQAMRKVVIQR